MAICDGKYDDYDDLRDMVRNTFLESYGTTAYEELLRARYLRREGRLLDEPKGTMDKAIDEAVDILKGGS